MRVVIIASISASKLDLAKILLFPKRFILKLVYAIINSTPQLMAHEAKMYQRNIESLRCSSFEAGEILTQTTSSVCWKFFHMIQNSYHYSLKIKLDIFKNQLTMAF